MAAADAEVADVDLAVEKEGAASAADEEAAAVLSV